MKVTAAKAPELCLRRRYHQTDRDPGAFRPVSEVNTADVLEILTPIWHVKAETARAVRQRIRSVLEWAIAMDLRNDNPCNRVVPVLGPQNDNVTHRQALPHKDVAAVGLKRPPAGTTGPRFAGGSKGRAAPPRQPLVPSSPHR